jgi:hypothetical protein
MKKPARPPRKSQIHFEQIPVAVVRQIALLATPKPSAPGARKPAVRPSREKAD